MWLATIVIAVVIFSSFLLNGMWNSSINAVSLQNGKKRSVNNFLFHTGEKLTNEFTEHKLELKNCCPNHLKMLLNHSR